MTGATEGVGWPDLHRDPCSKAGALPKLRHNRGIRVTSLRAPAGVGTGRAALVDGSSGKSGRLNSEISTCGPWSTALPPRQPLGGPEGQVRTISATGRRRRLQFFLMVLETAAPVAGSCTPACAAPERSSTSSALNGPRHPRRQLAAGTATVISPWPCGAPRYRSRCRGGLAVPWFNTAGPWCGTPHVSVSERHDSPSARSGDSSVAATRAGWLTCGRGMRDSRAGGCLPAGAGRLGEGSAIRGGRASRRGALIR